MAQRLRRNRKARYLKQSKSDKFLQKFRAHNPMVEYITQVRMMNPAAHMSSLYHPPREGSFVRLAHASEEFEAPRLTKGKSVLSTLNEVRSCGRTSKTQKR